MDDAERAAQLLLAHGQELPLCGHCFRVAAGFCTRATPPEPWKFACKNCAMELARYAVKEYSIRIDVTYLDASPLSSNDRADLFGERQFRRVWKQ